MHITPFSILLSFAHSIVFQVFISPQDIQLYQLFYSCIVMEKRLLLILLLICCCLVMTAGAAGVWYEYTQTEGSTCTPGEDSNDENAKTYTLQKDKTKKDKLTCMPKTCGEGYFIQGMPYICAAVEAQDDDDSDNETPSKPPEKQEETVPVAQQEIQRLGYFQLTDAMKNQSYRAAGHFVSVPESEVQMYGGAKGPKPNNTSECINAATDAGAIAFGVRTDKHPDKQLKGTCWYYKPDDRFTSISPTAEKTYHYTQCIDPTKSPETGCK